MGAIASSLAHSAHLCFTRSSLALDDALSIKVRLGRVTSRVCLIGETREHAQHVVCRRVEEEGERVPSMFRWSSGGVEGIVSRCRPTIVGEPLESFACVHDDGTCSCGEIGCVPKAIKTGGGGKPLCGLCSTALVHRIGELLGQAARVLSARAGRTRGVKS